MKTETVSIDSIREDPRNARRHPAKNLKAIKKSLKRFGQRLPLVVRDGVVVVGNGRLRVMRDLGWGAVDVVRADDLTVKEARAFGVADNRTGELAEWDDSQLAEMLREFDRDTVEDIGFDVVVSDIDLGDGHITPGPAADEPADGEPDVVRVVAVVPAENHREARKQIRTIVKELGGFVTS